MDFVDYCVYKEIATTILKNWAILKFLIKKLIRNILPIYLLDPDVEEDSSKNIEKTNVAIVDDERDLLFLYRKTLRFAGFNTVAFSDPALALKELKESHQKYGIVISDIRMPKINGYQLANEIKSIDSHLKVILMSAYDISESIISSNLQKGIKIDGFISKPFPITKLINIVKTILEK